MMATVAGAPRWSVPVPSLSDRRSPVGITGSKKKKKKAVTGPGRCGYRCPVLCAGSTGAGVEMRTCKNCKTQYDPSLNHPLACRFHTAHFGGETKRKFESVYTGGTMSTPDSGQVFQYWHCCGSEDPFDVGCTAAPHCSYDD